MSNSFISQLNSFDFIKDYSRKKTPQQVKSMFNIPIMFEPISKNIPKISYRLFNNLYYSLNKKDGFENLSAFKKSLFRSKNEYEQLMNSLITIKYKYNLINTSLFVLNYYIGRFFYSYFLYYFPVKRRFMYNLQFLLVPAFSLFCINNIQDLFSIDLNQEIKASSLFYMFLWFDTNYKTGKLDKNNINLLDNEVQTDTHYMSKATLSLNTVKKFLFYKYLKVEYLKLVLAKEVVSNANSDKSAELDKAFFELKSNDILEKLHEKVKGVIDFLFKNEDDPEISIPHLDNNNWTNYLDYSDLNNLLASIQIYNDYVKGVEELLKAKETNTKHKNPGEESYKDWKQNYSSDLYNHSSLNSYSQLEQELITKIANLKANRDVYTSCFNLKFKH